MGSNVDPGKNELELFLDGFPSLADHKSQLIDELQTITFPKGSILIREGQPLNYCYFVLKGCIRQYVNDEGVEKTINFFTEHQGVVSFSAGPDNRFSDHYLECMEECMVIRGEMNGGGEMLEQIPALREIIGKMIEADLGQTQEELKRFILLSPEERYGYLLQQRPELIARVPQKYIASYLGIAPESFSRMKRRIVNRES
ncbi:Crp/Fnr family transcriptional regulator [Terrimonas ferruginea]|uniref:Crp/Fnr family transcriptional regulator n=1 Tax=Terrimonas ferruginea TaxID=249 RepID=UPI000424CAD0|nr:Crp/Fnr family transcriptional regulator [Terrimonas ferruginea]